MTRFPYTRERIVCDREMVRVAGEIIRLLRGSIKPLRILVLSPGFPDDFPSRQYSYTSALMRVLVEQWPEIDNSWEFKFSVEENPLGEYAGGGTWVCVMDAQPPPSFLEVFWWRIWQFACVWFIPRIWTVPHPF